MAEVYRVSKQQLIYTQNIQAGSAIPKTSKTCTPDSALRLPQMVCTKLFESYRRLSNRFTDT